jgi:hypothetical protein
MPGALRHDDELIGTERRRLLLAVRLEPDRGVTLEDHDDLVARGVAFPLAPSGRVCEEDPAVAVVRELPERAVGLLDRRGRSPVGQEHQGGDGFRDRDRVRAGRSHALRLRVSVGLLGRFDRQSSVQCAECVVHKEFRLCAPCRAGPAGPQVHP